MLPIADSDVKARIERDNPWWGDPKFPIREAEFPRRVYFSSLEGLALNFKVRRAVVLLGPRRVGKTVMLKQLIHEAILQGVDSQSILYASVDAPVYSGYSLERFLHFLPEAKRQGKCLVIFDEIQYLRDWETHLKDLVDSFPNIKFVASGSAAAALRLKSRESGAGRFSDFMLPPLTFYEFLSFTGNDQNLIAVTGKKYSANDIGKLNSLFIDYLNYGGYPEVVLNKEIRSNQEQFIRNDIIDKVLLKDLPSLYGIDQIQELNRLFCFLAYNAGGETSLENISRESGISKPTIKRYIEYLESAFLIIKLTTVDDNCRTLERERNFKIYLNNPSMRAALFTPVKEEEVDKIGRLAECAVFSQWQHSLAFRSLRYARWKHGEVDIVYLRPADDKPEWIGEIKWSDRIRTHSNEETLAIQTLLKNHKSIKSAFFTTKTMAGNWEVLGKDLGVRPTSLYCYTVGRNITSNLDIMATTKAAA